MLRQYVKIASMPKFSKKLSFKQFILSHILILLIGLIFLGGLYYILNIQYQKSNNPFLNGPVTTPPKSLRLDLDQPDDDSLFYSASIIISGKTGPGRDVLISQNTQDLVLKSKADGSFSTILKLDKGVNKITAVVFDQTGDLRSEDRSVYYSEEKL